jgi:hypothetical protein
MSAPEQPHGWPARTSEARARFGVRVGGGLQATTRREAEQSLPRIGGNSVTSIVGGMAAGADT